MNYDLIFNEDTGKYVHITSKEGLQLLNLYSSFLKKKKIRKNKIIIDTKYKSLHAYDLVFTTIGKLKYNLLLTNISTIHLSLEHCFLYILYMFSQDKLYMSINLYHFIYILHKCRQHFKHKYRVTSVQNICSSNSDTMYKTNKDILQYYNKKYSLSEITIQKLISTLNQDMFDSIKTFLNIHTYIQIMDGCIKKHFIKKKYIIQYIQ